MLKKMITYEGLDGQPVTEEFWFHLSKADLIELELAAQGGMAAQLQRIVDSNDNRQIYNEFKRILMFAYGAKSDDGKRFVKNQKLRDEFEGSEAFSTLIMELLSDEDAAAVFVNAIVPRDMAVNQMDLDTNYPRPVAALADEPERKVLTPSEIDKMDAEELKAGLASGKYVIGG